MPRLPDGFLSAFEENVFKLLMRRKQMPQLHDDARAAELVAMLLEQCKVAMTMHRGELPPSQIVLTEPDYLTLANGAQRVGIFEDGLLIGLPFAVARNAYRTYLRVL